MPTPPLQHQQEPYSPPKNQTLPLPPPLHHQKQLRSASHHSNHSTEAQPPKHDARPAHSHFGKVFESEKKEFRDIKSFLYAKQQTIMSFIGTRNTMKCANRIKIYVVALLFFVFGGNLVSTSYMTFETFSSLMYFIWVLNSAFSGLLLTFTDTKTASVALPSVYDIVDNAFAQIT